MVDPISIPTKQEQAEEVVIATVGDNEITVPSNLSARLVLDYLDKIQNGGVGITLDRDFLNQVLGDKQMKIIMDADGFELTHITQLAAAVLQVVFEGK